MNIGRYMESFKFDAPCLVISSRGIARSGRGQAITYYPEDGGSVDLVDTIAKVDKSHILLTDDPDAITQLIRSAQLITEQNSPTHHYIDTFSIPIVLSMGEYDWLD